MNVLYKSMVTVNFMITVLNASWTILMPSYAFIVRPDPINSGMKCSMSNDRAKLSKTSSTIKDLYNVNFWNMKYRRNMPKVHYCF